MQTGYYRLPHVIMNSINDKNDTTMKEKILDAFKALGLEMEDMEGLGYGFEYEGKHFLYMYNEDDEDFLNIALPAVLDIDDENNVGFYQVMDKINGTLKYVKANKLNDSMWLFYERELFGDEDMMQILSRMILHSEAGLMFLRRAMASSEEDRDSASEVTDRDTDNCTDGKEDVA